MALPIRDGNQSLTTLSTILVSNSHIPAHTVVSFGTQGITDIATAVSGVELGPNTLNALENITVTLGQVTITGGLTDAQLRASAVTIGGSVTASISGTASVTFGTAVVTGSASILNFPTTQTVTFTQASVTFGTTVITGSTSVLNFPATQPVSIASVTIGNSITIGSLPNISGTVTVSNLPATQAVTFGQSTITGSVSILNLPATQTVTFSQASVTFGTAVVTGSTSILNFPSTQTVTFGTSVVTGSVSVLNFPAFQSVTFTTASVTFGTAVITGSTSILGTATITGSTSILNFPATQPVSIASVTVGNSITIGSLPAISGTVTAVLSGSSYVEIAGGIQNYVFDYTSFPISGTVTIGAGTAQIGSVTASISNFPATQAVSLASVPTHGVTLASTTVTVSALPRPTWTNYSGTVTTANTAITAISTTTRSYLLAQVTTGQMFLNIGATATSMNSVYFSAGQGFAWETTVPQGIVSIISSVTGTNYVLKEG